MLIKEKDFEGFADGCEKAFEVIFRQYYKTLVSFSMRYGLEQMEAEDVVIEVIHRIWEIRKEVKSPAALNALFYTSVRNRTVNVVRNLKNRKQIIGKQEKPEESEFRDYLMEEEVSRVLNEAIENLPPQCRQVVMLILAGKTMTEIARQLDISVSSVKTYKSRAIEILKTVFQNYPLLLLWLIFRLE
ncbi:MULTISPECIES: RNA polymerase sigma factor [Culturomica]|uniref:RNA polymerase sigma factor n=1 Tax=Culturomica TaxID=1926651 RepID=UPI000E8F7242|nr:MULTISPECIES: sigma-70 family RNA polymerase sigma factor [Culturomica]HBO25820.1 hypothetical protein [Culturomica sp.]